MNTHRFDDFQRDGETHERYHEDSVHYSSSESSSNFAISATKNTKSNREGEEVSSRANKKTQLGSSMRSEFVIYEENRTKNNMQRKFQELSSVVPGLNMKDEDLILDDAISYLKLLRERANILKEQNKYIYVAKACGFGDSDIGESSSSSIYQFKQDLPEIEAKVEGKSVLIKVHFENKKEHFSKVIREIEKLHLNVENISSLPFGEHFLDITVTAQISDDTFITTKDIKRELREALKLFM